MTYSLGEVEALSRKAVRGAGLSWGMAEDAGKAVRWLCGWGLPGAEALAGYLEDRGRTSGPVDATSEDWQAASDRLCPLICGTALSDLGALSETRLHNVAWPLLLVPYIAHPTRTATITWGDSRMCWNDDLFTTGTMLTPDTETVTLAPSCPATGAPCHPTQRADLDPDTLACLTRFAARTYAPETEASKLTGAGAGLTDKD